MKRLNPDLISTTRSTWAKAAEHRRKYRLYYRAKAHIILAWLDIKDWTKGFFSWLFAPLRRQWYGHMVEKETHEPEPVEYNERPFCREDPHMWC